jgi:hypothetical protein
MRFVKYIAGTALAVGLFFGMTRQPVIDAAPEPFKTGLQKVRLDMDKIAAGNGWKAPKKPGTGAANDDGGIPLFKSHGVPN